MKRGERWRVGLCGLILVLFSSTVPALAGAASNTPPVTPKTAKGTFAGTVWSPDAHLKLGKFRLDIDGMKTVRVAADGTFSTQLREGRHIVTLRYETYTWGSRTRGPEITVEAGRTTTTDIGYITVAAHATSGGTDYLKLYGIGTGSGGGYSTLPPDATAIRWIGDTPFRVSAAAKDKNLAPTWAGGDTPQAATVFPSTASVEVEIDFRTGAVIDGTVRLPKKATRTDRQVTIRRVGGAYRGQTVATTTGTFSFVGLPPGDYEFSFARGMGFSRSAGGYFRNVPESAPTANRNLAHVDTLGETVQVNQDQRRIRSGRVTGRFISARTGEPPRGTYTVLFVPRNKSLSRKIGCIDKRGNLLASGLSAGKYRLRWETLYGFTPARGVPRRAIVRVGRTLNLGSFRYRGGSIGLNGGEHCPR